MKKTQQKLKTLQNSSTGNVEAKEQKIGMLE